MKAQHTLTSKISGFQNTPTVVDLGEVDVRYLEESLPQLTRRSWQQPAGCFLLVLNLKGKFTLNETVVLEDRQINLFRVSSPDLTIDAQAGPLQCLFIYFSATSLEGLLTSEADWQQGTLAAFTAQPISIDLSLHNTIQALLNCRFEGDIRRIFLLGKCLEMLALFFEAHDREQRTRYVHCKTEYDRERLMFAREYLLQRYDLPPSLDELARIAGLNVFKLKNGFKELFGKPVFVWLNDYKMELAHRELLYNVKTAGQLAYDLGYSSLSHFSRAFRRQFGYPPGRVKKGN